MPGIVKLLPLLAAVAVSSTLSCSWGGRESDNEDASHERARSFEAVGDVLATVNGVSISEWDVVNKVKDASHTAQITPQYRKNALETLIREELFRQRALELGLDADAKYRERLSLLEAQVNAFERKELAALLLRREAEKKTVFTEEDARKYFDENVSRIRTELHVWQILKKGQKDAIERALAGIRSGTPFEEVAEAQFPKLPKTAGRPWDLGYLRWQQVPGAWRDVVYDLKEGEVSGIIQGAGDRFWIIKLVDKRENREVTFESIRPAIMDVLKSEATATLRERTERYLRDTARIVYREGPAAATEE